MSTTGRTIVTAALREIRVINAVDEPSAEDLDLGLKTLNRILNLWNAKRAAAYCESVATYTLTTGTTPQTIGPAGLWACLTRPMEILGIGLWQGDTRTPLTRRTRAWWRALADPAASGTPTDYYYEPTWPAGEVYLYPTPDAADTVEVWSRVALAAMDEGTDVTLPQGIEDALTLTLAERLAPAFGTAGQLTPLTIEAARQARAVVFAANREAPVMRNDAPGAGGGGGWDYQSGGMVGPFGSGMIGGGL